MTRRIYPVSPATAAMAFLFLVAKETYAFLTPAASTMTISSRASSHHPKNRNRRGKKRMSSTTEDDPWVSLEEFKAWTISGKYDLIEFENAINTLRHECQFNIRTLEEDIESIQQTLHEREHHQSQCTSSDWSSQQHVNDSHDSDRTHGEDEDPMPTLKAVFAGYQATEEDRKRMSSAHPEDCS
mmetsp:Transcript_36803/g.67571  ORF Transcript_36803/g.67571 Transcript_36803/m.67571 type:complete len:184 (-) Transcript_36803:20-571(-)